ncbi:MAG TPA: hypothetical protein VKA95_00265 [Nitrososphaeraceae archaeon]|nr:hypothetical protein [Nitrososphaeraceae archaeon]
MYICTFHFSPTMMIIIISVGPIYNNDNDNEQPLLEQTTLSEDFHNMLNSYDWEDEGYEIVVIK